MDPTKNIVTWADYYPEVAEIFAHNVLDWPCEKIDTGFGPVVQPCIAQGPRQEIYVSGYRGHVFHSLDLGATWSLLCQAPGLNPPVPPGGELAYLQVEGGVTLGGVEVGGIGATREGTLLLLWTMSYKDGREGRDEGDVSHRRTTWVTRSADRGKTWEATAPFEHELFRIITANQGNLVQLADGRILAHVLARSSTPGAPKTTASLLYASDDDGRTWTHFSDFVGPSSEPHLMEVEPGRMLAALRYQRDKRPDDPENLATGYDAEWWAEFAHHQNPWDKPTDTGVRIFQHTALSASRDGGRTWSKPRVVTGLLQQSASLIKLSDGTLALTFGRPGQRLMLSYDGGETWAKVAYQLHGDGEYARAVGLKDDTLVAIHDFGHYMWHQKNDTRLGVLRFKVPPRQEVEKHGFFAPRQVEQGLR